jgi:hypothetical protein
MKILNSSTTANQSVVGLNKTHLPNFNKTLITSTHSIGYIDCVMDQLERHVPDTSFLGRLFAAALF